MTTKNVEISAAQNEVPFSYIDAKSIKDALTVSPEWSVSLGGSVVPFKPEFLREMIVEGIYRGLSAGTAKDLARAQTDAEKTAILREVWEANLAGFKTPAAQKAAAKALITPAAGGGKTTKPAAFGRQEILGLLCERVTPEQAAKIRSYDDMAWSAFLIKYAESTLLKGVYADLVEARALAAERALQEQIAAIDDFDF